MALCGSRATRVRARRTRANVGKGSEGDRHWPAAGPEVRCRGTKCSARRPRSENCKSGSTRLDRRRRKQGLALHQSKHAARKRATPRRPRPQISMIHERKRRISIKQLRVEMLSLLTALLYAERTAQKRRPLDL